MHLSYSCSPFLTCSCTLILATILAFSPHGSLSLATLTVRHTLPSTLSSHSPPIHFPLSCHPVRVMLLYVTHVLSLLHRHINTSQWWSVIPILCLHPEPIHTPQRPSAHFPSLSLKSLSTPLLVSCSTHQGSRLRFATIGPYRITEKFGELNYRLQLPKQMMDKKVHNVFHISLLTKAPHNEIIRRHPTNPPPIIIDSEEEWEVEEILDSRFKNRQLQYLIKWTGTNSAENSWEPDKNLANAPEAISDFHNKHPEAPRRLRAALFKGMPWRPLENYTLSSKKDEVKRILHSRDLVPWRGGTVTGSYI